MDEFATQMKVALEGMRRIIDTVNKHTDQLEAMKVVVKATAETLMERCKSVELLEAKVEKLEKERSNEA